LLFGQRRLRPLLLLRRASFVDDSLRLQDLSFGTFERCFEIFHVHERDDLAGTHHIAFIDA
jgi:hypothetical protein